MTDVELVPGDVRASAGRIGEAGEAVRTSPHPSHVADVASALSGSASAGAARRVYTAWTSDSSTWSDAAARQSSNMVAAVTDSQAQDATSAASLQRMSTRLGPTPR